MMYLNTIDNVLDQVVGPLVEELEGRCLLSSAPLAAAMAAASEPANAVVQPVSLTGTFAGTAHVGRVSTGLLSASGVHSVPATLSLTEGANGLLTGLLTFGPATNFTVQTFSVQGVVKGHSFDAAIWQGAAGTAATSVGEVRGHINGSGSILHGNLFARLNGKSDRATFSLTPSGSAQATLVAATPDTSTTLEDFIGSARLHVPRGFAGIVPAVAGTSTTPTSGNTGFSINITGQSADGMLAGNLFVQNLGTFDFVGVRSGRSESIFFDGPAGSGEFKGRVASDDVSVSGSMFDNLSGQVLTAHVTARNSAAPAPASASATSASSNIAANTLNNTALGLGLGGTPFAAGTGATTTNGVGNTGFTNTSTTTTTTVGTGLGGTPASTSTSAPLGGSANGTLDGFPVFTGSVGSAGGSVGSAGGSVGSTGGSIGTPGSNSFLVGGVGSNVGLGAPGAVSDLVGSVGSSGGSIGMPGSSTMLVGSVGSSGGSLSSAGESLSATGLG
ncbi:MAG TPA: hypothetical protein VH370_27310 [Humisphaera sp.]|nr:hypothetical protein [Humisphaera sp.]